MDLSSCSFSTCKAFIRINITNYELRTKSQKSHPPQGGERMYLLSRVDQQTQTAVLGSRSWSTSDPFERQVQGSVAHEAAGMNQKWRHF